MTAHERETIQDRCARCDGTPDAQALLAEARAQVEEARRERDEAREKARVSDRCRLANEAELRRADAQIGHLRAALKEAGEGAAQALLAEKALAAEKAALVARVGVLSAALERLHPERLDFDSHSDECMECRSSYSCDSDMEPTPECHSCAHAVLERARSAARAALEVEP